MGKKTRWFVFVTIAVIFGAAFGVDRGADVVARRAVVDALRKTFRTDVAVDSVTVDLLDLSVRIVGLRVADAPGFGPEPLLEVPSAHGKLAHLTGATTEPTIDATVDAGAVLRIRFGPDGTLNLDAARAAPPPPSPQSASKPVKLVLRDVKLDGVQVEIDDHPSGAPPTRITLDAVELTLRDLAIGDVPGRDPKHDGDVRVRGGLRAGDADPAPFVVAAAIGPGPLANAPVHARLDVVGFDLAPLESVGTEAKALLGGRFVDVQTDLAIVDRRLDTGIDVVSSGGEKTHVAIVGPIDEPKIDDRSGLLAALNLPVEKLRRLANATYDVAGTVVTGGESALESLGDVGRSAVETTSNAVESVVDSAKDATTEAGKIVKDPKTLPGAVVDGAETVGKGALDLFKGAVEKGGELVKDGSRVVTNTAKGAFEETAEEAEKRKREVIARYHQAVIAVLEFRERFAREHGDAETAERIAKEVEEEKKAGPR